MALSDIIDDADKAGLLTEDEHRAVELAGQLWTLLGTIVGNGPTRGDDMAELTTSIHQIQNAVLANAAARAYPSTYRPLGGYLEHEVEPRCGFAFAHEPIDDDGNVLQTVGGLARVCTCWHAAGHLSGIHQCSCSRRTEFPEPKAITS